MSYIWDVNVENGKFKIVLINISNKRIIKTICDGSGNGCSEISNLSAENYYIKFVGDNTTVSGKFNITENKYNTRGSNGKRKNY